MESVTRVCTTCNIEKSLDEFRGGNRRCRKCATARVKAKYEEDIEANRGKARLRYRKKNPLKFRGLSGVTKVCAKCKLEKPVEEFGTVRALSDGKRYACKDCYNAVRRDWRNRNKEYVAKQKRGYYYRDHDKSKEARRARYEQVREWKLMREYGMTLADYDKMFMDQGGKCAICKEDGTASNRNARFSPLHVDHNHVTGRVRGLLCNSCNTGLGSMRDSIANLTEAIRYLTQDQQEPQNETTTTPLVSMPGTVWGEWRSSVNAPCCLELAHQKCPEDGA